MGRSGTAGPGVGSGCSDFTCLRGRTRWVWSVVRGAAGVGFSGGEVSSSLSGFSRLRLASVESITTMPANST